MDASTARGSGEGVPPTDSQLSSSQPRATLFFCDLVGSTELSGRLDPERFARLIQRYRAEVRGTVEGRYDGRIIGQEGDGLLAVFGAPRAHGDDAERAVRAALSVVEEVRALSSEIADEVGETLFVRIGVHRGQVYREGDVGGVYGLAVNTAARLQTLARANEVVVSDEVRNFIGDGFELEAREPERVKGIPEPLPSYRVVGERSDVSLRTVSDRPLVDRVAELQRLRETWRMVRDGRDLRSLGVTLRGDPGIGKTRLVSTVAVEVAAEGAAVVELSGSPFFADVELYPVRRLLERESSIHGELEGVTRLAHLREELRTRGLDAESLLPLLAPFIGIEPAAGYIAVEAEARRLAEQIAEAARAYVAACLGSEPCLLVAQDLHWFDAATRRLVIRLMTEDRRCLLFATTRPGADPIEGTAVIDLRPLTRPESGALIDALSPSLLRPDARESLIDRSDGIPLYIEELVTSAGHAGSSDVDQSGAPVPDAVPDLLYDLLAARLVPAGNLISVATAAAAIGREFDLALVAAAVEATEEQVRPSLETLQAQGVLDTTGDEPSQFRFRHELLREVAYELQPPSQRRSVHGRVADGLMRSFADGRVIDWPVTASHLVLAGRLPEAIDAYERATDAARMRGSFSEARRHLGRAIDLMVAETPPHPGRDRHEVLLRLQRGYIAVSEEGNTSLSAASDYERCLELAATDPAGDEMFKAVIVLWAYHAVRGDLGQARRISEFTLRNIAKREWYRKFNMAAFGMIDAWEGDYRSAHEALESFSRARVPLDEERFQSEWFSPSDPVSGILTCSAMVRFVVGDESGAEEQWAQARVHAEGMAFPAGPFSLAHALSFEAWAHMECRRLDVADQLIARVMELSAEHGFDGWMTVAVTQHNVSTALRVLESGVHDPAALRSHAEALQGMIELWKAVDTLFFLPYYLTTAGSLFASAGDRTAAHAQLTASLDVARETGMHFYDVETMRHLARLELNPEGRLERLREALDLARRQAAFLFELRVANDLYDLGGDGDGDALRTALKRFPDGTGYPEVALASRLLAAPS